MSKTTSSDQSLLARIRTKDGGADPSKWYKIKYCSEPQYANVTFCIVTKEDEIDKNKVKLQFDNGLVIKGKDAKEVKLVELDDGVKLVIKTKPNQSGDIKAIVLWIFDDGSEPEREFLFRIKRRKTEESVNILNNGRTQNGGGRE